MDHVRKGRERNREGKGNGSGNDVGNRHLPTLRPYPREPRGGGR